MKPTIIYYPAVESKKELTDVVSRAAWFLSSVPLGKILICISDSSLKDVAWQAAPGMDPSIADRFESLRAMVEFVVINNDEDYEHAFDEASIALRWNIGRSQEGVYSDKLSSRVEEKQVFDVDPQNHRKEGSAYIDISHNFLLDKKNVIEKQKKKFQDIVLKIGTFENAYVLATGPSVSEFDRFDYTNAFSIVCNSIILNDELLKKVAPKFVVFGDPIFHFGPSQYAASFRKHLLSAVERYDLTIFTTFKNYPILAAALPEIEHKVIAVPFRTHRDYNFDLFSDFEVKTTGNILTLAMLPLAATFSKSISILGCDGRPLDDNSYFWKHNPSTQINDKMSNIKEVHPAFFKIDYNDYYTKHCNVLEEMLDEGESKGWRFKSLAASYIPALKSRSPELKKENLYVKNQVMMVEPDAISWRDHFMNFNEKVVSHLEMASCDAHVICHKNIEKSILNKFSFMSPSLSEQSILIGKNFENHGAIEEFGLELIAAIHQVKKSESFSLICYHGSIGHAEALEKILHSFPKAKAIVNLYWNMWAECHSPKWLDRIKKLAPRLKGLSNRLFLTVPTTQLQALLLDKCGIQVDVIPQPSMIAGDEFFLNQLSTSHVKSPNIISLKGDFHVFFPGSARAGKGFDRSIDAAEHLVAKADVNVTIRQRHPDEKKGKRIEARLSSLPSAIKIARGELSNDELLKIYTSSHVVVLPYDSEAFLRRTSGLLIDAILNGVPVVTSRNCWLGDVVERYACGVTIIEPTPENICEAVEKIRTNFDEFSSNAYSAAKDYFAKNSWDSLVNFLQIKSSANKTTVASVKVDVAKTQADNVGQRRMLIIGNGPSTKEIADIGFHTLPDDVDTFGMGAAYRYFERIDWWPTYYALADSKVVHSHREALKKLIEDSEIPTKRFYFAGSLLKNDRFEDIRHGSTGDFCFRKSLELGYDEVYLIGIEGSYTEEISESRPLSDEEFNELGFEVLNLRPELRKMLIITKMPKKNPNYFFDDYQRVGDVYSLPQSNIHKKRWSKSAAALKAGVQVYNLSKFSEIKEFPKVSLEAFLQNKQKVDREAFLSRVEAIYGVKSELHDHNNLRDQDKKPDYRKINNQHDIEVWEKRREVNASVNETAVVAGLLNERRGAAHNLIDVGAHHGGSAKYFCKLGWNVYCFEPDSENRQTLIKSLNGLDRVLIDARAVSDKIARGVSFFTSEQSTGISGLSAFHDSHSEKGTVDVTTVAEIVADQNIDHIDFLKIDVEGFDFNVLKGVPWDEITPDVIECEYEDAKTVPMGHTWRDIAEYLREKGYTVYISEWHPIIRYGIPHDWRRVVPYPGVDVPSESWGNILAFREDPGYEKIQEAFKAVMKKRPPEAKSQAAPAAKAGVGAASPKNSAEVQKTQTLARPAHSFKRPFYARFGDGLKRRSPQGFALLQFTRRALSGLWRRRAWALPVLAVFAGLLVLGFLPALAPFKYALWAAAGLGVIFFAIFYLGLRVFQLSRAQSRAASQLRSQLNMSKEQLRAATEVVNKDVAALKDTTSRIRLQLEVSMKDVGREIATLKDQLRASREAGLETSTKLDDAFNAARSLRHEIDSMRHAEERLVLKVDEMLSDISQLQEQVRLSRAGKIALEESLSKAEADFSQKIASTARDLRSFDTAAKQEIAAVRSEFGRELKLVRETESGLSQKIEAAEREARSVGGAAKEEFASVRSEIHDLNKFSNHSNARDLRIHERLLSTDDISEINRVWQKRLGLSLTARELKYLAHQICLDEERCEGRMATTVQAATLRALALMSLNAKHVELLEIGTLFGIAAGSLYRVGKRSQSKVSLTVIDPLDGYYGKSAKDNQTGAYITKDVFEDNLASLGVSSTDYRIIQELSSNPKAIEAASDRQYDYVLIDGDHSLHGVSMDFELYGPLVKPGGLLIFDDYDTTDWPDIKPFVDEHVKTNKDWLWIGGQWRTAIFRRTVRGASQA